MSGSHFLFSNNSFHEPGEEISISIPNEKLTALFELAETYGSFHITRSPEGYILDIGKFKFSLEDYVDRCRIIILGVHTLSKEVADLCAKLAAYLFTHRPERPKILAHNPEELKLFWESCKQHQVNIIAADKAQQDLFTQWEADEVIAQAPTNHPKELSFGLFKPVSALSDTHLSFIFSQTEAVTEIGIYIEAGRFHQLFEMAEAYGNFFLTKTPQGMMLDIGQYKFTASQHFNLLTMSLINVSRLHMGAAELIAKVLRLLFGENTPGMTLGNMSEESTKLLWQKMTAQNIKAVALTSSQQQLFNLLEKEYVLLQMQKQRTFTLNQTRNQKQNPSVDISPSPDKQ